MLFNDIKPFVRYARYLTLDPYSSYPLRIPYDSRLFFTQSGCGVITVKNKKYIMKPGSVLLLSSGNTYHLQPPDTNVTYLAFNFDYTWQHSDIVIPIVPDSPQNFQPEHLLEHVIFDDFQPFNEVIYLSDMEKQEHRLVKIIHEYSRKIAFYSTLNSNLFSEILIACARALKLQDSSNKHANTDKILNYIHENYEKPLTNAQIGQLFGFHPNYISMLVKNSTGFSLHQYLINVRISHAIDMLEAGNRSIREIAQASGFSDIYYFSRYFKAVTGLCPTNYQK